MKCENCGKEHDSSYGSGRFCSKSCRCSFNSKKQTHFASKEELAKRKGFGYKAKEGGWKCSKCGLIFRTRAELRYHYKEFGHSNNSGWNKGLTKETDSRVAKNAYAVSKSLKAGYASGKIIFSEERKKNLSQIRKKFL